MPNYAAVSTHELQNIGRQKTFLIKTLEAVNI